MGASEFDIITDSHGRSTVGFPFDLSPHLAVIVISILSAHFEQSSASGHHHTVLRLLTHG